MLWNICPHGLIKRLRASYQSKRAPSLRCSFSHGRPLWRVSSSNESFPQTQKHTHNGDVNLRGKLVSGKILGMWRRTGMGRTLRNLHNHSPSSINICFCLLPLQRWFYRQTRYAVYESFGLFISTVKPLEQESNHPKQIGNVSAALVKVEERQAQAAGGAGVRKKMLQMQMMDIHFHQTDEK